MTRYGDINLSTLAKVMACCLMTQSLYLNQRWLINKSTNVFCGIYLRANLQVLIMNLFSKLLTHLPGTNEQEIWEQFQFHDGIFFFFFTWKYCSADASSVRAANVDPFFCSIASCKSAWNDLESEDKETKHVSTIGNNERFAKEFSMTFSFILLYLQKSNCHQLMKSNHEKKNISSTNWKVMNEMVPCLYKTTRLLIEKLYFHYKCITCMN